MGRQYWANALGGMVYRFIANGLIAWGISQLIAPPSERLILILIIWAGLYVVPWILKLKETALAFVLHWLERKKSRELMLVELRQADMPVDEGYPYWDADLYFEKVAKAGSATPKQRMKAVEFSATLNTLRQTAMLRALFANYAIEGALRDYFAQYSRDDQSQEHLE